VRLNLAEFIERDASAKNFIPYSLDASIADLIEQANCETSSMNEYYRWVSATMDIVRHTTDGEITHEDLAERKTFIGMSYDREAEILLCLSLYEAAGRGNNKDKIELLTFKLARLRELRSIVKNTTGHIRLNRKKRMEDLVGCYEYCKKLLTKDFNDCDFVNLKLKLDIDHSDDEDLDKSFSYLDYVRACILYMMRMMELPKSQHERKDNSLLDEPANIIVKNATNKRKQKPEQTNKTDYRVIRKNGKFEKIFYTKE
jgi:hypothetical protein